MLSWIIGATIMVGIALGMGAFIEQSIREISRHHQGFTKITQSLVQPPRPSFKIPIQKKGKKRSYRYQGQTITFSFSSHYQKTVGKNP